MLNFLNKTKKETKNHLTTHDILISKRSLKDLSPEELIDVISGTSVMASVFILLTEEYNYRLQNGPRDA